jgi:hypothetical protein
MLGNQAAAQSGRALAMIKIPVTPLQPRAGTADCARRDAGTTPGRVCSPLSRVRTVALLRDRLNFELQPLPSGWSLNDYSERVGGRLQIFFC